MASFEVVMGEARLSTFFNRICPSVAMPTRGGGSRGLPAQHDAQLIASPVTPAALLLNRGPAATRVRSVRCHAGSNALLLILLIVEGSVIQYRARLNLRKFTAVPGSNIQN